MIFSTKNNLVTILDIGSSKIVCFIAKIMNDMSMEILGVGYQNSLGIKGGNIVNIKEAAEAIILSVDSAEKMAGIRIKKVWINVSAVNSHLEKVEEEITVGGAEITKRSINKLRYQLMDRYKEQDMEILHLFPVRYFLDNTQEIDNPINMFGSTLKCEYIVSLAHSNILRNITKCINKCGLELEGYLATPVVNADSSLTEDEKVLGSLILEIGGGNSSITLFKDNMTVFTESLPLGGENITNDIHQCLMIPKSDAQRLKTLYGSSMKLTEKYYEKIEVFDGKMVDKGMLNEVIHARVEEILVLLKEKLDRSKFKDTAYKTLVLVGGVAETKDIVKLVSTIFDKEVRIALPKMVKGLAETTTSPNFITSVGMLLHVLNLYVAANSPKSANNNSTLQSVYEWVRELFAV